MIFIAVPRLTFLIAVFCTGLTASVSITSAQALGDRARFLNGTCSVPAKTVGFFFPAPYSEIGHVIQVSADEEWLSIRADSRGNKLLLHTNQKTSLLGFGALSQLAPGDAAKVLVWQDDDGQLVAQSIERIRKERIFRGTIDKIARPPSQPVALWLVQEGVPSGPDPSGPDVPSALATGTTQWRNAIPPDLLPGQFVQVTSTKDGWWDRNGEQVPVPIAEAVEVETPDDLVWQENITHLTWGGRSAASIELEGLPIQILLNASQLENHSESSKSATVRAHRRSDGEWEARDISFDDSLLVTGEERVSLPPAFPHVFVWDSPRHQWWPTEWVESGMALRRVDFSYRRERRYRPIFWILTLGFLALPERNTIDVHLDRGTPREESCKFELGSGRVKTTLSALKSAGFPGIP